jgi:hypothetical protein
MNDLPMPGPLDDFLDHPPTRPVSAALREGLLQRTAAMVRRRRRMRVLVAAGAIVAVAMIAATIVWLRPAGDVQPAEAKPADDHPIVRTPPAAVEPETPTAVALEWQAFDAPRDQKSTLYRQAGDRYVEDADDLTSAVRCYGQAVRAASTEELAVAEQDNWLVRALKIDEIERRKEQ